MRGDFTRFSHRAERHYAGVLMQQGRVTLDADWNEQFEIDDHRWRVQTVDTVGRACAPEDEAGFRLSFTPDGSDLVIHPGRIYLDGLLVELAVGAPVRVVAIDDATVTLAHLAPDDRPLAPGQWVEVVSDETEHPGGPDRTLARIESVDAEAPSVTLAADPSSHSGQTEVRLRRVVTYLTQPHYPAAAGPPFADPFDPAAWGGRTHLAYLDVWRRHVTALEDPHLREVALGGPDTATRVQTVWAVRLLRDPEKRGEPADASGLACHDPHPLWDALMAPPRGRMSARAEAAPAEDDPCAVQPEAGYRGLENRLYRVEIHAPGPLGTATFKWSRDNGSVLASIVAFPQVDEVEVHSLGRDKVLRFHADDRVEAFSEVSELAGLAGTMASIVGAPDEADRTIALDTDVAAYDGHPLPRLRRWDHGGPEPVTADAWLELEHGVQIRFRGGPFDVGDYWVVPARVATGDVEGFVEAPRRGIQHHYARLAFVRWPTDGDPGAVVDCRSTFPSLCGLTGGGADCCTVSVGAGGDVDSLQAAVDALAQVEGPARICVLPGEHRFQGPVVVRRSHLTVSGCGRTSRLVAVSGGVLVVDDCHDVRIEDLWLTATSDEPVVAARDVRRFEVVDCRITNPGPRSEPELDLVTAPPEEAGGPAGLLAAMPRLPLGPGLRVDRGGLVTVRHSTFVAGPAALLQGVGLAFEHNLALGGGVHVREGSEHVTVASSTVQGGRGPGVLLGGVLEGEEPLDDRVGLARVVVAGNRIGGTAGEGISSDAANPSEIDDLAVRGNEVQGCGRRTSGRGVAVGGGILLRNVTGLTIAHNHVAGNGPPAAERTNVALGFGIVVLVSSGVRIEGNTVVDNGRPGRPEAFVFNAGVVGLGVSGQGGAAGPQSLGPAAAAIVGNTITTPEGPGVVLAGLGAMAVNDNDIVSTYLAPSLLDAGRAVLILNLGAPADTGHAVVNAALVHWPLRHGRVMVADNQISVQADPAGLPPIDRGVDPGSMDPDDLLVGSSVAVRTRDDLSLAGNQILSETHLTRTTGDRRIRAAVWAQAATIRTNHNRMSEVIRSALLSYFGSGLLHVVTDNVTTHCLRAEGSVVRERDNLAVNCPKAGFVGPGAYVAWEG